MVCMQTAALARWQSDTDTKQSHSEHARFLSVLKPKLGSTSELICDLFADFHLSRSVFLLSMSIFSQHVTAVYFTVYRFNSFLLWSLEGGKKTQIILLKRV